MKRLLTLIIGLCGLCSIALAQNPVFAKYVEMDDVKYVSIGKSMIKQMAKNGKIQIGDVNISGLGKEMEINNILIISSSHPEARSQMSKDHVDTIVPNYQNLVTTREGKKMLSAVYFLEGKKNNELVMYVKDEDECIFIVLNGPFKQSDIERMFL